MNKVIVVVILLLIAVAVLGYTQGWFGLAKDKEGHVKGLSFDKEKFKKDKEAAKKYLADKKKAIAELLSWMLTSGQKYCSSLGYAPLPREVAARALRAVDALK